MSVTRTIIRTIIVISVSLLIVGLMALDLRRVWVPLGVFGYVTDGDGVVTQLRPGEPAARAGIRLGDRIDVAATSPQVRFAVVQGTFAWAPGGSVTVAVIHDGVRRDVTMISASRPPPSGWLTWWILGFVATLVFVVVGAALVLLRPGPTTWGFFWYCLAFAPGSWISAWALPFPANVYTNVGYMVLQCLGIVGVLVFALTFRVEAPARWRRISLRFTPLIFASLVALASWAEVQMYMIGGPPGDLLFRAVLAFQTAIAVFALFCMIDTYARARGPDRQRVTWVLTGFTVALVAASVNQFLIYYVPVAAWVYILLGDIGVAVPLAIGYAVIRYRIIDVSVIVSRTLVYGALTTLLVGIFSIIDWFFTDYLRLVRLGTAAEIGSVLAFGFWFNALHARAAGFVNGVFFRRRHRAEVALARNAAALPYATSQKVIGRALVDEPVRVLELASAALFRRTIGDEYLRDTSIGWTDGSIDRLDEADGHLLALLRGNAGPLSLDDHLWREDHVPGGPAQPCIAVPIIVRGEIAAVAFYGSHLHGEGLDPDEIKAIAALAPGAGTAYDHLAAADMRAALEAMSREVASLRARLAER